MQFYTHTHTHNSEETQYILYIDKLQLILDNEDLLILLLRNEKKKSRNKTEKWIWLELWRERLYLAFRFLRLGIKILWMKQLKTKLYLKQAHGRKIARNDSCVREGICNRKIRTPSNYFIKVIRWEVRLQLNISIEQ